MKIYNSIIDNIFILSIIIINNTNGSYPKAR